MQPLTSSKIKTYSGHAIVSGDKSISHRAIMLSCVAIGTTTITGLLEGDDVMCTIKAFQDMGVSIKKSEQGSQSWIVDGVGIGGLCSPIGILQMGNSGTSARLIMGIISAHNIKAVLSGDNSLNNRPMGRVITPLEKMGVKIDSRDGCLPLCLVGSDEILPITYELPVASAQVKSAILLAGLASRGAVSVIETTPTRDHTENMLKHFGAKISIEKITSSDSTQKTKITYKGGQILKSKNIIVPADPSSAAFIVGGACIVKGSDVLIKNVCMNKTRTGFFTTLKQMGAHISYSNKQISCGEDISDIHVKYAPLTAIKLDPKLTASMIDEFPILAVVSAFAKGTTYMTGIGELRVKESDRLSAIVDGLDKCGVKTESGDDWITIFSTGAVRGDAFIKTNLDHRLAMSFLVMAMASQKPITIDDGEPIKTSFPTFIKLMTSLGAKFTHTAS